VTVIDPRSNEIVDSTAVVEEPRSIVYDPSNGYLYVTDLGLGAIFIIPTESSLAGSDAITYEVVAISVVLFIAGIATVVVIRGRRPKNRYRL
jgi:DNA-binding beta-propeller fold protein YncE